MEAIFSRRSVRKFKNIPVEPEKIEKILRAAMQAPSAGNQQPWEFIVIQDKQHLQALTFVSPYATPVTEAPAAIVVCGRTEGLIFTDFITQDLSAAIQNILLEVTSLGLGAVWIGVHPLQERVDLLNKLCSLPPHLQGFAVIPFGYPADNTTAQSRYDTSRIHNEKWTRKD